MRQTFIILSVVLIISNIVTASLTGSRDGVSVPNEFRKQLNNEGGSFPILSEEKKDLHRISDVSMYVPYEIVFGQALQIDNTGELFELNLISSKVDQIAWYFKDDDGEWMNIGVLNGDDTFHVVNRSLFGIGESSVPAISFSLADASVGTWTFKFEKEGSEGVEAFLLVSSRPSFSCSAFAQSRDFFVGVASKVKVMCGWDQDGDNYGQMVGIERIEGYVTYGSDGERHLGVAKKNDEIVFEWSRGGDATIVVDVYMKDEKVNYKRTMHIGIGIESDAVSVDVGSIGVVYDGERDNKRVFFQIGCDVVSQKQGDGSGTVMAFGAFDVDGSIVESGGIVDIVKVNGKSVVELSLHRRWLGESGRVVLKKLKLVSVDVYAVLYSSETLDVKVTVSEDIMTKMRNAGDDAEDVYASVNGPRPKRRLSDSSNKDKSVLMLVHGYCAKEVPFRTNFMKDTIEFKRFSTSMPNDEFAKRLLKFGEGYKSYSIASHSQGGLASLHLYTFYHSGLDEKGTNPDGILLQSVGSPYHGTPVAGFLAGIVSIFGIGCGPNHDLTKSGAEKWLTTIPKDKRAAVKYYRTSFKPSRFRFRRCALTTNLVLDRKKGNDGVVSVKSGELIGAKAALVAYNECHSSSMKYPPQCKNIARCVEISKNATR